MHSGGGCSLSPERTVINTLSMQWQANPAIEALVSYVLRYKLNFFETILPRLRKVYDCHARKSGSLYDINMRYDLLDSRSQFINH